MNAQLLYGFLPLKNYPSSEDFFSSNDDAHFQFQKQV